MGDKKSTDNVEESSHAKCGANKRPFTTEALNTDDEEETCGDDLDDTVDSGSEEGGIGAAISDGLEDLRGIVSVE